MSEDRNSPAVKQADLKGRLRGLLSDVLHHAAARGVPACRVRETAAAIDRLQFAQNPARATYVRAVLRGEFADASEGWLVAVRRFDGGRFCRLYFPALPSDLDNATAHRIALLIDAVFERLAAHTATQQQN